MRSWAQRSAVRFAALALLLGTLGAVVPGIISPVAAGAATASVTWNTALTCGTYDYAVVPPGTTSITATIYGGGGGGAAGSGTGGTWPATGSGGHDHGHLRGDSRHQHRGRHRLWRRGQNH